MSTTNDQGHGEQPRIDFFISYTAVDSRCAQWIASILKEAGYHIIIQAWDFRPGTNFVADMDEAIIHAERTLLVLSEAYFNSDFAFAEWAAAFRADPRGRQGKVLPVRIQRCEVRGLLGPIGYIDLVDLDEQKARDKLLEGVKRERARPTYASPSGPSSHNQNRFDHTRRQFLIGGGIAALVLLTTGVAIENRRKSELGPSSFSSLYQQSLGAAINTLEYAPDNTYLAAARGDQTAQIISASTGIPILTYRQHTGNVNVVTWSKDGARLASASSDKTAQVWRASDGKQLLIYKGHTDLVTCVAWSSDGGKIASTSYDKTIQVWNPISGNRFVTCQGHTQKVWWVAWSPDNRQLVSGSEDGTVRLWDASTGKSIGNPYTGHRGPVFTVRWSIDGNHVASAGQDSNLHIWDPRTRQDNMVCQGHTQPIRDLAWSSDNTHLVSGSEDQTFRIWAVETQQPLATYQNSQNSTAILACVYSGDGNQIAIGNYAGVLQIWKKNQWV